MALERTPISPMAVPREAMAETRGRAMANSDPKTTNRTMAAIRTPSPVPPSWGLLAASAICPETATFTSAESADWAVDTSLSATASETFWACWSKVTVAKATVFVGLTWWAPAGS